jgi:hypothetical protein
MWAAVIAWAGAALSILLGQMTLRIDDRGITLAPWGLPMPVSIPFDQVVEAHAELVHPLSWGGAREPGDQRPLGDVATHRTWYHPGPRGRPEARPCSGSGRRRGGLVNSHLDRARGGPYTGPLRRLQDGRPRSDPATRPGVAWDAYDRGAPEWR